MALRRWLPFCTLLLGLGLPLAHQAMAQDIPPRSKLGAPPKGAGLRAWCTAKVSYTYGSYNRPTYANLSTKRRVIVVDGDLLFRKVEACVQSGGTIY